MPTPRRANFVRRFLNKIRNRALTYPQVYFPGLAGKVVKSLTSKSSSSHADAPQTAESSAAGADAGASHEIVLHTGNERYAPQGNGRTSGIVAAQAAAAPLPR